MGAELHDFTKNFKDLERVTDRHNLTGEATRFVGIDIGVTGAIAFLETVGPTGLRPINVIDIPVIGVKGSQRVDALAIRNWIRQHAPAHCYLERTQAYPEQGRSSIFKFGRATGAIEAVLACCEIPLTIVEPAAWKRFHHLYGKGKENSRQRALELFPAAHSWLARRKDHNRAEALLLAAYGASQSRVAA
jgi:crossover junction endodeoxyribonuclease RuvC